MFNNKKIAVIKRTAMNVYTTINKRNKIDEKIKRLTAERNELNAEIELFEAPIKAMTGGYTTEDLLVSKQTATGIDKKTGKIIKKTVFELKYPDTVVPPVQETPEAQMPEDAEQLDKEAQEVINDVFNQ